MTRVLLLREQETASLYLPYDMQPQEIILKHTHLSLEIKEKGNYRIVRHNT